MPVVTWFALGLAAGLLAERIAGVSRYGAVLDIVLGIIGALVGGVVANAFGFNGVTGLNLRSLMVAVGGSVLLLAIIRCFNRRAGT